MQYFVNGATGSDTASGTSEAQAFKTLAAVKRLPAGAHTVTVAKGAYFEPIPRRAGIHWKAQAPGEVILNGGVAAGGGWTKDAQGTWSKPWTQQPLGVFASTFEKIGKQASFFWRDYNQHNANPMKDINPADPATQFKWKGGQLYLRTPGNVDPQAAGVMVAVHNVGIDLGADEDGDSDVTVEGFTTRYHGSAVGTGRARNVHFIDCDFGYCGKTAVWLTKLAGSSMLRCRVQGAGNWAGHYEDCIAINGGQSVIIDQCRVSWGGHSGILCLGVGDLRILASVLENLGGSGITIKQGTNRAQIHYNTIRGVAGVAQLTVHRVPHYCFQLSGEENAITDNVMEESGGGIIATSTNAQACKRNRISRNTIQRMEGAALDWGENEGAGTMGGDDISQNIIRECCRGRWANGDPQINLIQTASAARPRVVLATFSDNFIDTSGRVNLSGNIVSPTQTAAGFQGNDSTRTENRGASAVQPPPQPPEPPVPPPAAGKPVITRITPARGPGGIVVRLEGTGFGVGCAVTVPVPTGSRRLEPPGGTDTAVSFTMPVDAVTGEVRVRRIDTTPTQLSEPVTFTVQGGPAPNQPPVARSGGPYRGVVGQPVRFDGSGSTDGDGRIAEYRWQFQGFTGFIGGAVTRRTFDAPGTYTVTLTVTDDRGATATATTTATITAAEPPPATNLVVAVEFTPINVGGDFSGTVRATPPQPLPAGSTLTLVVTTPDGRTGNGRAVIQGEEPPPGGDASAEVLEVIRLHNLARSGQGLPALAARATAASAGEIGEPWAGAPVEREMSLLAAGEVAAAGPLDDQAQLRRAAQDYAARMHAEGFFSHTSPEGGTPWERIAAAGYQGRTLGENLARGFSTPLAAMQALLNSPGHRANILNPSFREIGVGIAGTGSGKVWCITYGG